LLAAEPSQRVELGTAVVLTGLPLGGNPSLLFQLVQGGIERSVAHLKDVAGNLLQALADCPAIERLQCQDLQQQQVPIPGDVLLSKDGTIGRVVHYESDLGVVVLSSIAILRPKTSVDSSYLAQALRSDAFRQQLLVLESGSALRRIVLRDIRRLTFYFPPEKAKQAKIAELL
jgi:type I restriction enzyme S subunit